jgi:hypothetical protein
MQLENGTYGGRPVAGVAGSVYETENKAVMLALRFKLVTADEPEITFRTCLVTKDGSLMTKNIENLRKWSGWDGVDPYWFMETDLSGIEVELVIENKPGWKDPSKVFPEVQWVNPPGARGGGTMPEASDKKALLAKYGSKFRALAGPQPVGKPAPKPSAPPAAPSRPTPAASAVKKVHSQETAWALMQEKAAGISNEQIEAFWFKFVDATGMDQAEMTPEGWALVEAAIIKQAETQEGFLPF